MVSGRQFFALASVMALLADTRECFAFFLSLREENADLRREHSRQLHNLLASRSGGTRRQCKVIVGINRIGPGAQVPAGSSNYSST
jgi:hypothetical protein